jgi:transposase-like protein
VPHAARELAESLGVSEQMLRNWRRQDQRDRHERDDGPTPDDVSRARR